jgi:hypothetical protein
MQIIARIELELYTNDFEGYKLEISYIWGYANRKGSIPLIQNTREIKEMAVGWTCSLNGRNRRPI